MIEKLAAATALIVSALSLAACGGDGSPASSAATSTTTTASSSSATSTPAVTSSATTTPAKTTSTTSTPSKTTTSASTTTTTTTGTKTASTGTTTSVPTIVKSIQQWVSCSETIDETSQLAAAIAAATNNAFVLQVDCPVRFHTGSTASSSINVPSGVTFKFVGAGEFLMVSNGPPALNIADPQQVTFIDYNQTFL